jgi:hypothetical protein
LAAIVAFSAPEIQPFLAFTIFRFTLRAVRIKMSKARRDGLYLLLLGSLVAVSLGSLLSNASPVSVVDFRVVYYPARCLIQHCDPYSESAVLQVVQTEGGERPSDHGNANHFARYLYLPSAFFLTVPFAMLPWGLAHTLWIGLIEGGLILAAFLMWNLGADYSPAVSGALIGFYLANCEVLIVLGNIAGIAIGLCLVGVWCFLRDRFVIGGLLCFAVSLAVKPHDSGLVWLFFLLAGGVYRRRALQTLLAAVVLGLPGTLWAWRVSPNWMQEMRSNLLAFSSHGNASDPGIALTGLHGLGMMVNLQTVFSAFWSDPHFYNLASYLVCGPLLLVWALVTVRSRSTASGAWLALAAIATLSLLPVYHRQYDSKLLLLTAPACAMLWTERGIVGWLALLLNGLGLIVTGDISWIAILSLIERLFASAPSLSARILTNVQVFSAPCILLSLGVFYLWVYVARSSGKSTSAAVPDLSVARIT